MFLNDEQKASLGAQLQNMHNDPPETPAPATVAESESVSGTSDSKSASAKDVKTTEASSAEESGNQNDGHAVPYSRFKDVNDTKKQLQQKNSKLEKELNELRSQLTQKNDVKVEEKSDLDKYLDSLTENDDDKKYADLNTRLSAFEMKNAQVELDAEIKDITKEYPNVPKGILLQAIIQNPDSNLLHVAKEYSQMVAEIEERALAKYKASAPATSHSAPPRPQPVPSTGNSVGQNNGRPRTMAEARAAALSYFKQNGI